jgi:uncharacterized GH25 family protein
VVSFFFSFIDSCGNPFAGSKVSITAYAPPYVSGSVLNMGFPIISYTDSNGYVEFDNFTAGVYGVIVGNVNDNIQLSKNYPGTLFYIQLSNTGSLVNGQTLII